MQVSELAEILIANRVVVFSFRPPLGRPARAANWPVNDSDKWIVGFRQLDQESVWHYSDARITLEEAMMNALEKIEALLGNKRITHVAFGRTTVPGPKRFASIEGSDREFYHGTGETVTEATEAAMTKAEKDLSKKLKAQAQPETRYFHHPESDCVFTTEDGSRPVGDGLVEEIDHSEYLLLQAQYDAAKAQAQPAPVDPLEDLLG